MSQELANAVKARSDLQDILNRPGWDAFLERFDQKFAELTRVVLTTPNSESLRAARQKIEEEFAPETLMKNFIKKLEYEIQTEQNKENERRRLSPILTDRAPD